MVATIELNLTYAATAQQIDYGRKNATSRAVGSKGQTLGVYRRSRSRKMDCG
jgi:hypothetical protein